MGPSRGLKDTEEVEKLSKKHGIRAGSSIRNIFQNQEYKYGSLGNPIRRPAHGHRSHSGVRGIAEALHSRDVSPWFADGSNYPGTQNIRKRLRFFEEV